MNNIDNLLEYLQSNKFNFSDDLNSAIVSRIYCSNIIDSGMVNSYSLKYLIKLSPTKLTCNLLIRESTYSDYILKACIAYQYNSIYFEKVNTFNYDLYELASKTNNIEVYNHQLSLCQDLNIIKLPLEFDYLIYLF